MWEILIDWQSVTQKCVMFGDVMPVDVIMSYVLLVLTLQRNNGGIADRSAVCDAEVWYVCCCDVYRCCCLVCRCYRVAHVGIADTDWRSVIQKCFKYVSLLC